MKNRGGNIEKLVKPEIKNSFMKNESGILF